MELFELLKADFDAAGICQNFVVHGCVCVCVLGKVNKKKPIIEPIKNTLISIKQWLMLTKITKNSM